MDNFLLFLNISGGEILVILVVVYLVFGPKKIPELARMLGKGINELRRATEDIKKEFDREVSSVKKDMNVDVDIDLEDPLNTKGSTTATNNPDTVHRGEKPFQNQEADNHQKKPPAKKDKRKEENKSRKKDQNTNKEKNNNN